MNEYDDIPICLIVIADNDGIGYCGAGEEVFICKKHSSMVNELFSPKVARIIHLLVAAENWVSITEDGKHWHVGCEEPDPFPVVCWRDHTNTEPQLFAMPVEVIEVKVPVFTDWDSVLFREIVTTEVVQVPKAWIADLIRKDES